MNPMKQALYIDDGREISKEDEVWLPVSDAEIKDIIPGRYFVSNYCRIMSIITDTIEKEVKTNNGYLRSFIYSKNKPRGLYRLNHRIGMKEFKPLNDYTHMQVNHIDGNKSNNSIENLEWISGSDNIKHAYETGLKKPSNTNNRDKRLSDEKVREIGNLLLEQKYTHKQIAELTNTSIPQVNGLSAGYCYKDIHLELGLDKLKREYNG